jgi:hypothetical protein
VLVPSETRHAEDTEYRERLTEAKLPTVRTVRSRPKQDLRCGVTYAFCVNGVHPPTALACLIAQALMSALNSIL